MWLKRKPKCKHEDWLLDSATKAEYTFTHYPYLAQYKYRYLYTFYFRCKLCDYKEVEKENIVTNIKEPDLAVPERLYKKYNLIYNHDTNRYSILKKWLK